MMNQRISMARPASRTPRLPAPGHLARALLLGLCLLLSGCLVGPDWAPPKPQVPDKWSHAGQDQSKAAAEAKLAAWWTIFNDPKLTSLEQRALASSLDLKLAQAKVRQARAARGVVMGGLGPSLDAGGSFQRSRTPLTTAGATGESLGNRYQAGFDASWELDIFGGTRRQVEAADADLAAAVEGHNQVLVTLMAEVARNYLELRTLQERLAIARSNLAAQRHTSQITGQRFTAGLASGLDLANAQAQAATTAAQVPLLESSLWQSLHSLGVLLGQAPASLAQELLPPAALPPDPPAVPLGLPSDLLRRRPDIRQAEAQIHAATARVGVATADLYPRFTLSAGAGFQAGAMDSWFSWGQRYWSLGPSFIWRIFESGRIEANIELQRAQEEEALLTYRQTVLTALQEVEDALVASAREQEHRTLLRDAVAANRKAVTLAKELYDQGQVDFLNVLTAQGALYSSEDSLSRSNGNLATYLIALYKALGGGWQAPAPAPAASQDKKL